MVADLIQQVRELLASSKTNPTRLALEAGLSVNALRGANAEGWNPSAETLLKLERYIADQNSESEDGDSGILEAASRGSADDLCPAEAVA